MPDDLPPEETERIRVSTRGGQSPASSDEMVAATVLQVFVLRFPDGSLDVEVHWKGAPPPRDHIAAAMATAGIAACNATIVESLGVRLSPVVGMGPDADV